MNFTEAFSIDELTKTFNKISKQKDLSTGMDRVSLKKLTKGNNFDTFVEHLHNNLISSKYKVVRYKEMLRLKSKDKKPRCICIPSIKDRIVFKIIDTKFLKPILDGQNKVIDIMKKIVEDINGNTNYSFFRTDLKDYYDDIDHRLLMDILNNEKIDQQVINLIDKAINTSTDGYKNKPNNAFGDRKGIPQGIEISNSLAELYSRKLDEELKKIDAKYYRYVDDILFLFDETKYCNDNIQEHINYCLDKFKLQKISLSDENGKTISGNLHTNTTFNYLGYEVSNKYISIKKKSIEKQMNRLERLFFDYINSSHKHIKNNLDLLRWKIDIEVSGLIRKGQYYGFIKHFIACNNVSIFYKLDKFVDKLVLKHCPKLLNSKKHYMGKRYSKVYFEVIKYRNSRVKESKNIINIDKKYGIADEQKMLLIDVFGFDQKKLNNDNIYPIFNGLIKKTIYEMERDLDFKYNL